MAPGVVENSETFSEPLDNIGASVIINELINQPAYLMDTIKPLENCGLVKLLTSKKQVENSENGDLIKLKSKEVVKHDKELVKSDKEQVKNSENHTKPLRKCAVKTCKKPVENAVKVMRPVVRPKVLKNHESRVFLYDRLYGTTCPRVVSLKF